jgi:lipid A ethanolaminephosphotransferase
MMQRFSKMWQQRECGVASFVLLAALINSALFQWPLFLRAVRSIDGFDTGTVLSLLTLLVLQLLICTTVLGLVSLVSLRLLKAVCILFLFGNTIALYFIVQYNILIDITMVSNILHTNLAESMDLLHPKILIYLVVFALVPTVIIVKFRIKQQSFLKKTGLLLLSMALGAAWLHFNAPSWLWLDKNAKQFGSVMLPWSYVVNPIRYGIQENKRNKVVQLLPALTTLNPQRTVVVLVIGESARAANFSLFGYTRDTNPLLKRNHVIAIANAQACATYTTASVHCMLSHLGEAASSSNDEPLPSYLSRHGVQVMWRTNNFGEPPIQVASYENGNDIRRQCQGDCTRLDYDALLVENLAQRLQGAPTGAKTLVVLHQAGSHGPQYFQKYPPAFETFKPVCKTVEVQKCSAAELVNAYDNSIVYTDYVLNQTIEALKSLKDTASVMLYMSDHGESLGEQGLYLHGIPKSIAPSTQTAVPLIAWMSDTFQQSRQLNSNRLNIPAQPSHDLIFHSVLGALGMSSAIYEPAKDLFRQASNPSKP